MDIQKSAPETLLLPVVIARVKLNPQKKTEDVLTVLFPVFM